MFSSEFLILIERSLQAELDSCGVTLIESGHTTGWRRVPALVTSQIEYPASISLKSRKPLRIKPSETLCLPTDMLHRVDVAAGRVGISRWSHCRFHLLGGIDICSYITLPYVIGGELSERIGVINARLTSLTQEGLTAVVERKRALYDLMSVLVSAAELKPFAVDTVNAVSRLAPALECIAINLKSHLSSEKLAALCSLSRSRFDTLFRKGVGMPPGQHIQRLRLQRAQLMLRSTDNLVEMVAGACGFPDQFHFSRIFKKHCGLSPSAYREYWQNAIM